MNKHASLNRAYRIIWSYAKQCLVVVSELAKSHGKPSGERSISLVVLAESSHAFYSTYPPPLVGFKLKPSKYPVSLMGGLSLMTAAVSISLPSVVNAGDCATGPYTGAGAGCLNTGSITSLTNSGSDILIDGTIATYGAGVSIISSTGAGIYNAGTMGTLSNAGTISGTSYGIINFNGTIGTLSNSGTIVSQHATIPTDNTLHDGIGNYSGTIGELINTGTGTIMGMGTNGVYNDSGTISTLSNSGLISGGRQGVSNFHGSIGTLSNSGTISGGAIGVFNFFGTIGALVNSGLTDGGTVGLVNAGTILSLSNSLTISGGALAWVMPVSSGG